MIDVVIAARNEARDLSACLESLANTRMARWLRPTFARLDLVTLRDAVSAPCWRISRSNRS